jgi:hypothetical protein|tara:strand:+ start:186 stop:428 length:243 start_codon:yes stop_codon:yes gene_type:complete
MENISLDDFLSNGMIQEKKFRNKVKSIDWTKFSDKKVMIKGCAQVAVPTWAYLIIVSNLSQYADRIYFGEPCSAVEIFKK